MEAELELKAIMKSAHMTSLVTEGDWKGAIGLMQLLGLWLAGCIATNAHTLT